MAYDDNFKHADDVISHLDSFVPNLNPILNVKYIGFVSIVAVTVYERAIKEIFIEFARKKHNVFGNFTEGFFDRINGRIKLRDLSKEYILKFGTKYDKRFKKNLDDADKLYLLSHGCPVRIAYGNIVTWRNDFAHEGKMNNTSTYEETVKAYNVGKEVIHCLYKSMHR